MNLVCDVIYKTERKNWYFKYILIYLLINYWYNEYNYTKSSSIKII